MKLGESLRLADHMIHKKDGTLIPSFNKCIINVVLRRLILFLLFALPTHPFVSCMR